MTAHPDPLDRAQELEEIQREQAIEDAHRAVAAIPVGVAGDCDLCGEWSGRLVNGVCAPCRDRLHLP